MTARTDEIQEPWPALDGESGRQTVESLKLWGQLVGKTRLALSPMVNHWWQVAFYVTARGLGTPALAVDGRALDLELDLVAHLLVARTSDGRTESMKLCPGPLAAFYAAYMELLGRLGIAVTIFPFTVEAPERVRLDQDPRVCAYDPDWANRFFRALLAADRLLERFRGGFTGKASPVHFFWGSFDLAATRFSGRPAPPHPGDARFPEAAFYAYAYPQPAGFEARPVEPAAARFEPALGEFVLPYRAVRAAPDPDAAVLAFLESTYLAAADLAHWDRAALERRAPAQRRPAPARGSTSARSAR